MIDTLSPKELAADFINKTDRNIFLTGRAGTGKTTFLREIKESTFKNTVVAAPTGIAAINAGGITLHSLFHLPFGSYVPDSNYFVSDQESVFFNPKTLIARLKMNSQKRKLLNELELLIIDEVSMLRADLLDAIDEILRYVRRKRNVPFGGVQILFIGDMLQLPPVVKDHESAVLGNYYSSMFFFKSKVIEQNPLIYVELEKVFRQSDDEFIELLNKLRQNELDDGSLEQLNSYYQPDMYFEDEDGQVYITTHNFKADKKNEIELSKIEAEPYEFEAEVEGEVSEYHFPHNQSLVLKEGAQVMFIKNDPSGEQRFFNGKIGKVVSLSPDEISVKCNDGTYVDVMQYTWENKKFRLNNETDEIEEDTIGTFKQYPLRLAWAITVHKSQGLTFEKAILDLSGTFTSGQVYVALSRLTSLKGLTLASPLPLSQFQTSQDIVDFSKSKKTNEILKSELSYSQKTYLKNLFEKVFEFNSLLISGRVLLKGYSEEGTLRGKYKSIGVDTLKTIDQIVDVGKKFVLQIKSILTNDSQGYLGKLQERTSKSKEYFNPILKELESAISDHVKAIKSNKKLKTYRKDLDSLINEILAAKRQLSKLNLIVEAYSKDKIPDKGEFHELAESNKAKIEKKEKKKPTKEITYEFFLEGNSVEEIAEIRGLVPGTIAAHLVDYVKSGEVDVIKFIEQEKIDNIIKVKEETQAEKYTDIKRYLGEEYSYEDIRFALAHLERMTELSKNE